MVVSVDVWREHAPSTPSPRERRPLLGLIGGILCLARVNAAPTLGLSPAGGGTGAPLHGPGPAFLPRLPGVTVALAVTGTCFLPLVLLSASLISCLYVSFVHAGSCSLTGWDASSLRRLSSFLLPLFSPLFSSPHFFKFSSAFLKFSSPCTAHHPPPCLAFICPPLSLLPLSLSLAEQTGRAARGESRQRSCSVRPPPSLSGEAN